MAVGAANHRRPVNVVTCRHRWALCIAIDAGIE